MRAASVDFARAALRVSLSFDQPRTVASGEPAPSVGVTKREPGAVTQTPSAASRNRSLTL